MAIQPTSIHTSLEKVVEAIGDIKMDPWSKFSGTNQRDSLGQDGSSKRDQTSNSFADELQKLIEQEAQRRKDQQNHSGTSGFFDKKKSEESNRFKSMAEAQAQMALAKENQKYQQKNIIPPTTFKQVAQELGTYVPRSQEEHYSLLPKTFQPSEFEPRSVLHSMLGLIGGYSWSPLRKRHYRSGGGSGGALGSGSSPSLSKQTSSGPENLSRLFDSFAIAALRCHVIRQRSINAGINEDVILQSEALMDTLKNQINAEVENLKKHMSKDQIADLPIDRVTFRETLDAFLFERSILDMNNSNNSNNLLMNNQSNSNNKNTTTTMNTSLLASSDNAVKSPDDDLPLESSFSLGMFSNMASNTSFGNYDNKNAANTLAKKHAKNNNVGFGFSPSQIALSVNNRAAMHSSSTQSSPNQMTIGRSAVGSVVTNLQKKMDTSTDEPDRPFELMDPESRVLAYDAVFDSIDIRRAGDITWNAFFSSITQASLLPKLGGLVHHPRIMDFSHWILPTKMREIFGNVHHVATFSKGDAQIICANDAACIVHLPRKQDSGNGGGGSGGNSNNNNQDGSNNNGRRKTTSDDEKCETFFSSLKYIVTHELVRCFVGGKSVAEKNRPIESFAEKLKRQKREQKEADSRRQRQMNTGEHHGANDDDNNGDNNNNNDSKGRKSQRSKKEDENLVYGDRITALSQPKKTREPPPQVVQVLVVERVQAIIISSTDGTVKFFQIGGSQSLPNCELYFTVICDQTISCICPAWDYETLFFGTRQGHVLSMDFPLPQKNLSSKVLKIHCMNVPPKRAGSVVAKAPSLLRSKKPPANSSKVPKTAHQCFIKEKTDEELANEAFRAIEVFDVNFKAQALPHKGIVSFIIHLEVEKAILSCSYDHTIMLSNETTLEPLVQYHGHTSGVHKAVHSDDYNFFVSIAFDSKPLVWSVSTAPSRKPPMELYDNVSPHMGTVVDVDYIPSSNIVITLDDQGVVKFWDMRLIHCFDSFATSKHQPSIMGTFNADSGSNVNEKFKDDIDLAKIMSMPLRFVGMSLMYEPSSLTSPTETLRIFVFSQYHGAAVCEWNLRLKERVVKNAAEDQPIVASFALNDDPDYQIVGNITAEHYRTWDLPSGHIRDIFSNENHVSGGGICVACLNKTKTVIAIGTRDGSIFVHNANTNSLIQGFKHAFGGSGDEAANIRRKKMAEKRTARHRNHFSEKYQGGYGKTNATQSMNPVSQICCFSHAPQFHLKRNAPRLMVMSLCLSLNQLHLVNLDPSAEGQIIDDASFHASRQSVNANNQGKKYGKGAQLSAALATAALEKGVYLELLDEFEQLESSSSSDDDEEFHHGDAKELLTQDGIRSPTSAFVLDDASNNNQDDNSHQRQHFVSFHDVGDKANYSNDEDGNSPSNNSNKLGSQHPGKKKKKKINVAKEYAKSGIEHTIRCFDVEQAVDLVLVGTSHAKIIGFALSNVCSTAALRIPVGTLLLPPPRSFSTTMKGDDDDQQHDEKNESNNSNNNIAAGEEEIQKKVSTGDLDPILVKVLTDINCAIAVTESGRMCLFSIGCPSMASSHHHNNRQSADAGADDIHFSSPTTNINESIWSSSHHVGTSPTNNNNNNNSSHETSTWSLTHVSEENTFNSPTSSRRQRQNEKNKKKKKGHLPNHFTPLACWHHTNEVQFSATQSPLPTIITFPDRLPHMLYIGDDKGFVTIYDLSPILTEGASLPRVVNRWFAHNFDHVSSIMFLSTKDHPETVCCTSGGDQSFHSFSMSGSLYFGSLDLHQRLSVLSVPHFVSDDLETFDIEKHQQRLRNAPGAQLIMSKKDIYEMASELVENESKDRAIQIVSQSLEQHHSMSTDGRDFGETMNDADEGGNIYHVQEGDNVDDEEFDEECEYEEEEEGENNNNNDGNTQGVVVKESSLATTAEGDVVAPTTNNYDEMERRHSSQRSIAEEVFESKIAQLNPDHLLATSDDGNHDRKRKRTKVMKRKKTEGAVTKTVNFPGYDHTTKDSNTNNSNLYASGCYASFGSASPFIPKIDPSINPYTDEVWHEAAVRLVMEALRRTLLVPRCRWVTPLQAVFWSKTAYNENSEDALQIVKSLVISNQQEQNQDTVHNNNNNNNKSGDNDDAKLFNLNDENNNNLKKPDEGEMDHGGDDGPSILSQISFEPWEQDSSTSSKTPTYHESLQMLSQQTQQELHQNSGVLGGTLGKAIEARNNHNNKNILHQVTRKPPTTGINANTLNVDGSGVCSHDTTGEAARTGGNGLFYKASPNLNRRSSRPGSAVGSSSSHGTPQKRQSVLDFAETRWGDAATSRYLYLNVERHKLAPPSPELTSSTDLKNSNNNITSTNSIEQSTLLPSSASNLKAENLLFHNNSSNNNDSKTKKNDKEDDDEEHDLLDATVNSQQLAATLLSNSENPPQSINDPSIQHALGDNQLELLEGKITGASPLHQVVQVLNLAIPPTLKYDDFSSASKSGGLTSSLLTSPLLQKNKNNPTNNNNNNKQQADINQKQLNNVIPSHHVRPSSAAISHRGVISSPSSVRTSGRSRQFSQTYSQRDILIATGKEGEHLSFEQKKILAAQEHARHLKEAEDERERMIEERDRDALERQKLRDEKLRNLPEARQELARAQSTRQLFSQLDSSPLRARAKEDEEAKLFGSGKKTVRGLVIHKNTVPPGLEDSIQRQRQKEEEHMQKKQNELADSDDEDSHTQQQDVNNCSSSSSTPSITLRPESRALLSKFSKLHSVAKLKQEGFSFMKTTTTPPPQRNSSSSSVVVGSIIQGTPSPQSMFRVGQESADRRREGNNSITNSQQRARSQMMMMNSSIVKGSSVHSGSNLKK